MSLNKRKCKQCNEVFQKVQALQFVCSPRCGIKYAKAQRVKKEQKEWNKRKEKLKPKVYSKKYKGLFQDEINKLARNIDTYFELPCIDCGKQYGKQADGAHLNNVNGNENIRFNLHNIHKSRSDCNQYSSEHKTGYREGLISRYGEEYFEYVKYGIGKEYKEIHITEQEIYDKLKIVRKINREFSTFTLKDPKSARTYFNKIIGIYN